MADHAEKALRLMAGVDDGLEAVVKTEIMGTPALAQASLEVLQVQIARAQVHATLAVAAAIEAAMVPRYISVPPPASGYPPATRWPEGTIIYT